MPPDADHHGDAGGILPDSVKPEPTSKVAPALKRGAESRLAPLPMNSIRCRRRIAALPLPPATAIVEASSAALLTVVETKAATSGRVDDLGPAALHESYC